MFNRGDDMSKIEWTETTWNPVSGCTKISEGCKNCYAMQFANRLQRMGVEKYKDGFQLTLHPNILLEPYSWKKKRMVFVNSMSDIFHEQIPFEFIKKIFEVMNSTQHIYQLLTKRADIMLEYSKKLRINDNIWFGVTVESQKYIDRIDYLKQVKTKIKFISFEPLLSPIDNIDLNGIDWIIVGGESGYNARPIEENWVIDLYSLSRNHNIPFFFKQWGGVNKKKLGRMLLGETYSEMPIL